MTLNLLLPAEESHSLSLSLSFSLFLYAYIHYTYTPTHTYTDIGPLLVGVQAEVLQLEVASQAVTTNLRMRTTMMMTMKRTGGFTV